MKDCVEVTQAELKRIIQERNVDVENRKRDVAIAIGRGIEKEALKVIEANLSVDEFLQLVWHQREGVRIVSIDNLPRTISDIISRVEKFGGLVELSKKQLHDPTSKYSDKEYHDNLYFNKCKNIAEDFKLESFHRIWLVDVENNERFNDKNVTHYIYDGNHRSLGLAIAIQKGAVYPDSIPVYYIEDREKLVSFE